MNTTISGEKMSIWSVVLYLVCTTGNGEYYFSNTNGTSYSKYLTRVIIA